MIVVIDANIWISAFCFGGPDSIPRRVLEYARQHHNIAIADEMEAEILQTLVRKFAWSERRAHQAIAFVLKNSVRVKLENTVWVCRDPKDNMYLECASRAQAHLLITGDKDLLVLGSYDGTKIAKPSQYLHAQQ